MLAAPEMRKESGEMKRSRRIAQCAGHEINVNVNKLIVQVVPAAAATMQQQNGEQQQQQQQGAEPEVECVKQMATHLAFPAKLKPNKASAIC